MIVSKIERRIKFFKKVRFLILTFAYLVRRKPLKNAFYALKCALFTISKKIFRKTGEFENDDAQKFAFFKNKNRFLASFLRKKSTFQRAKISPSLPEYWCMNYGQSSSRNIGKPSCFEKNAGITKEGFSTLSPNFGPPAPCSDAFAPSLCAGSGFLETRNPLGSLAPDFPMPSFLKVGTRPGSG
jgi:hypothetical protein